VTDNRRIDLAIHLANSWHHGQVDKAGMPYALHVLRVGLAGRTVDEMIVGFLHDLIEDTACEAIHLRDGGFTPAQVQSVVILTRPKGMDYHRYIQIVALDDLARAVKLNDLEDNLRPDRTGVLSDDLLTRYMGARAYLRNPS
jgi:guanosine-3',5'-bis(diphosphate) 3'-pyrophosphohydrolase